MKISILGRVREVVGRVLVSEAGVIGPWDTIVNFSAQETVLVECIVDGKGHHFLSGLQTPVGSPGTRVLQRGIGIQAKLKILKFE